MFCVERYCLKIMLGNKLNYSHGPLVQEGSKVVPYTQRSLINLSITFLDPGWHILYDYTYQIFYYNLM